MGNNQGKPQQEELEEQHDIRVTESSPSSSLSAVNIVVDTTTPATTCTNENKQQQQEQEQQQVPAAVVKDDVIQSEELSDDEDNTLDAATTPKTTHNKTAPPPVSDSSSESDSESETELMNKMYGFTKKGTTGQIKRPSEQHENNNTLKRKLVDLSKPVVQEDNEWMKSISLSPDTVLIKLGDVISHVGNTIVIKADNEYTTGQRVWEEQNRQKSLRTSTTMQLPPARPTVALSPPINPVVVTPSSDAMNELVTKRMKQQQRRKMMSKNDEFRQEEAEWKKTIILRIGEGTVVFNNERQPVGKISDVFGPVHQPFYKLAIGSTNEPAPTPKKDTASHSDDDEGMVDAEIEQKSKMPRLASDLDFISSLVDINIPTVSPASPKKLPMDQNSTEEITRTAEATTTTETIATVEQSLPSVDQQNEPSDSMVEQQNGSEGNANNGTEGDDVTFTEAQHDILPCEQVTHDVEMKNEVQVNMTGQILYFVVQHSTIMNVSHVIDTTIQGTDATGEKDQELDPEDLEFSDDEDEANAKKKTRSSSGNRSHNNDFQDHHRGGRGGGRGRGGRGGPRGRGRGRGGRFESYSHNYPSPYDNTPVDYADFAAKFNSSLPTPSALMDAPQNGEEQSYDFQAPSSPQYTPSSPTYTPDN